jgi:histidinol-phosphatase (PHP family)
MIDAVYDLHTHTRFSDGSAMDEMVSAAAEAGCDGIGLTDHCILVDDEFGRRDKYDLVNTYEQRREQIEELRTRTDIRVFDAVEMSYVPGTEPDIRSFLDTAAFDYSIGAVHFAGDNDYTSSASYVNRDDQGVQAAVDEYYETLVELIESELFDIVAHLDLPERHDHLRGMTTPDHYRAVVDAVANSRTIPEINAGRVFQSLGRVHPDPVVLDMFTARNIRFVLGTDSHTLDEIGRRLPALRDLLAHHPDLDIRAPPSTGVGSEPKESAGV